MKKILFLFLLLPSLLYGQSTAVTATITDSDGQTWNNGSYVITFVPVPGRPGPYFLDGQPFTPQVYNGFLSGAGVLTVSLPSSDHITPSGSQWQLIINPNATSGSISVPLSITGITLDLTSVLSSFAKGPRFPAGPSAYGYLDLEVFPIPLPGGLYFNVTQQVARQWDGTIWRNLTGGGSGTVVGQLNRIGSFSDPTTTKPTNGTVDTAGNLFTMPAITVANSTNAPFTFNQACTNPSQIVPGTNTRYACNIWNLTNSSTPN